MIEKCPKCGAEDAVYYENDVPGEPPPTTCKCDECGARFEVEADGEYDDGWKDCSSPGKEIVPEARP